MNPRLKPLGVLAKRFGRSGTFWLATLVLIIHLIPNLSHGLSLRRDALWDGAVWLVFTGHFTHWNTQHLVWDLLVFIALGLLCEAVSRKAFWWTLFGGGWAISVAFLACEPQLGSYRGLSGLDSALFALWLVIFWQYPSSGWRWRQLLLTLAFFGKLIFEFITQTSVFISGPDPGFIPVPLAHFVGALWGGLVGFFLIGSRRQMQHRGAEKRSGFEMMCS